MQLTAPRFDPSHDLVVHLDGRGLAGQLVVHLAMPVVIGRSELQQAEALGQRTQLGPGLGRMIGMVDLDALEPVLDRKSVV